MEDVDPEINSYHETIRYSRLYFITLVYKTNAGYNIINITHKK